jgi:hypothetical protein
MSIKANEVSSNALLNHAHYVDAQMSALDDAQDIGFHFKIRFSSELDHDATSIT